MNRGVVLLAGFFAFSGGRAPAWTAPVSREVDLGEPSRNRNVEFPLDPAESSEAQTHRVDVDAAEFMASTATRVFFSPEDDCDNIVISCLYRARKSIDAAVFLISHPGIADALVHAHMSGVKVRVIMDGRQAGSPVALDEALEKAGVPLVRTRGLGNMHNKFAVLDEKLVLTGSYNWTVGGASVNDENLILVRDNVAPFQRKFNALWARSLAAGPKPADKGGPVSRK